MENDDPAIWAAPLGFDREGLLSTAVLENLQGLAASKGVEHQAQVDRLTREIDVLEQTAGKEMAEDSRTSFRMIGEHYQTWNGVRKDPFVQLKPLTENLFLIHPMDGLRHNVNVLLPKVLKAMAQAIKQPGSVAPQPA
jgi:hypothetical protein